VSEVEGEARDERSLLAWQVAPHLPILGGVLAWFAVGQRGGLVIISIVVIATLVVGTAAHRVLWRATQTDQARRDSLVADLATTEAQLQQRESVSDLYVHLARRNQSLLERQIGQLVDLEQGERDPDRLAELFRLDHLATRMRRNAESLLVLSGEETPRRWGRAVPLADVVRAAVAEVEDYARVSIVIDENLSLSGRAVADVAHLLAELLENALMYSPPETRVTVRNHLVRTGDRACVVAIEDRGIGMSEGAMRAATDLLANPPDVGLEVTPRLGFHVVGRLAKRYHVEASLVSTPGGGVTALVRIPATLFPADASDLEASREMQADVRSAPAVAPAAMASVGSAPITASKAPAAMRER
jgi:signal transduction histidine kinase